jgi:uroporphyrin-3 C-methyltransferase
LSRVPPVPPSATAAPSGGWFSTLLLAVALVALVLSGLLWQRLDGIQQTLAQRTAEVEDAVEKSREAADQAVTHAQDLQARLSIAEVKLSEVTLQRAQLEELMLSVSRSRDDTLVLDIESGVRLAMQQAELTGSAQPILAALQAADRRIAKAAQPRLNPVQRAMARDMERIRASSGADLPLLASRLDELARAVDEWPLVNTPPKRRADAARAPKDRAPALPAKPATDAGVPVETAVPIPPMAPLPEPVAAARGVVDGSSASDGVDAEASGALGSWESVRAWWRHAWHQWMHQVVSATRDLVRVSRIEQPDAVLLAPDQAVFMRENLKLRLLNARLSLLSRQVPEARADLQAVRSTLVKYFDGGAPVTRQALHTLNDVLQSSKALDLPRPDDTLAALATAAGGR